MNLNSYFKIYGTPNFNLPINVRQESGMIYKIDFYVKFYSDTYVWINGEGNGKWFSFERFNGENYFNIGGSIGLLRNQFPLSTEPEIHTFTLSQMDLPPGYNYTFKCELSSPSKEGNYSYGVGYIGDDTNEFHLFDRNGVGYCADFYGMKIYGANGVVYHDFVPTQYNALKDLVTGEFYEPTGTGRVEYVYDGIVIEPKQKTLSGKGGSGSFTLIAKENWHLTSYASWIAPSMGGGSSVKGGPGTYTIDYTFGENPYDTIRTGEILFINEDKDFHTSGSARIDFTQKVNSGSVSNIYLGEIEVAEIHRGETPTTQIFLGETEVFSV